MTTSGSVSMVNSKSGSAILSASGMLPGSTTSGTVTITNGRGPATYTLATSRLVDRPGRFAGRLSTALRLRLEDITNGESAPRLVWTGTIGAMPTVSLGTYRPRESRTYRFTVSFPRGELPPGPSAGDNTVQGASMSIQYDWTVTGPA